MIAYKKYMNDFPAEITRLTEEGFVVREGTIAGDKVVLIYPPHMGIRWNKDNIIYRSSVWTYPEKKPVSLSFKKFGNWGEKPDLFIVPDTLKNTVAVEKIDGALLIISKFKGELITRTRGTFDAHTLANGMEIDELVRKYPKLFNNDLLNSEQYSILCEWTSPTNKIVLDYGSEPKLFLLGIIKHENYSYLEQDRVDTYSEFWDVPRPTTYEFNDIPTMLNSIKELKGKEGVCIFHDVDQNIIKVKSTDYLTKHAFKNDVNLETIIDMFLDYGKPDFNTFMQKLQSNFDYECSRMAESLVSKVIDASKQVNKIISHMQTFVTPLRSVPRKQAAEQILSSYGKTNRANFVFKLLDNKPLADQDYKKLLFQIAKQ